MVLNPPSKLNREDCSLLPLALSYWYRGQLVYSVCLFVYHEVLHSYTRGMMVRLLAFPAHGSSSGRVSSVAAAWRTPFLSKVWVKATYCLTMLRSWPCFVFWPFFLHFSSEMWASSQPKKIMQREANPCNSCGLTLGGFIARAPSSNKALSCNGGF